MAMKNFDAKQFLLEKGERVGLGIAVTLMVLLILGNLFMPSHGFFSGSPKENANAIKKITETKQRMMNPAFNKPSDSDKPQKGDVEKVLAQIGPKPIDPAQYAVAGQWFQPSDAGSTLRRMPDVLMPKEGYAEAAHIRIPTYVFGSDNGKDGVLVLLDDNSGGGPAKGMMPPGLPNLQAMYQKNPSQMRQGMGPPGMMMGRGRGMQVGQPKEAESAAKELKTRFVAFEKLGESNYTPAIQILPLRVAEIGASFPLRQQIQEFQNKLRLASAAAVREELAKEQSQKSDSNETQQQEPERSFRFIGVLVQRREVDPKTGTPKGNWEPINLEDTYKPFLIRTGNDKSEPDDPRYDPLIEDGLVMPLLKLFHENELSSGGAGGGVAGMRAPAPPEQRNRPGADEGKSEDDDNKYPGVADHLPTLKQALDELAKRNPQDVLQPPPSKFDTSKVKIFQRRGGDNTNQGMGAGGVLPGGMRPPTPPRPGGIGPMPPRPGGVVPPGKGPLTGPPGAQLQTGEQAEPPEYALIRLLDVTVQPGKTYEYQIKVRMANPNYHRYKEVASVGYAKDEFIESKDWFPIPTRVTVPSELVYYAVDQGPLDFDAWKKLPPADRAKQKRPYIQQVREDQVALQAHRWLDFFSNTDSKTLIPVGDWVVADRIVAYRGEYVGRTVRVEVPYWSPTRKAFVLAVDSKTRKRSPGVPVSFGSDNARGTEAILIDFDRGRHVYTRGGARPEDPDKAEDASAARKKGVEDTAATEVLILSADGKLLARNGAADTADEARKTRLDKVRAKVKEVREGKGGGTGSGQEFGGTN